MVYPVCGNPQFTINRIQNTGGWGAHRPWWKKTMLCVKILVRKPNLLQVVLATHSRGSLPNLLDGW